MRDSPFLFSAIKPPPAPSGAKEGRSVSIPLCRCVGIDHAENATVEEIIAIAREAAKESDR